MKKYCFILLSSLLLFTFSCSTSTDSPIPDDAIPVNLKNTESYNHNTGITGDEDGASIIVQAKHYEISDIIRNGETNWEAVYKYKPKSGFIGTDYIELELSTGSDGVSPPKNTELIKIKFIVK
jgi:hypothetical protein